MSHPIKSSPVSPLLFIVIVGGVTVAAAVVVIRRMQNRIDISECEMGKIKFSFSNFLSKYARHVQIKQEKHTHTYTEIYVCIHFETRKIRVRFGSLFSGVIE